MCKSCLGKHDGRRAKRDEYLHAPQPFGAAPVLEHFQFGQLHNHQDTARQDNPRKIAEANHSHLQNHSTMAILTNPLATPSQLYHRSSFSTLPRDLHDAIFISSQCLTQAAGRLLELPQSVTAQANVILARHWTVDSPMANEFSVRNPPWRSFQPLLC